MGKEYSIEVWRRAFNAWKAKANDPVGGLYVDRALDQAEADWNANNDNSKTAVTKVISVAEFQAAYRVADEKARDAFVKFVSTFK